MDPKIKQLLAKRDGVIREIRAHPDVISFDQQEDSDLGWKLKCKAADRHDHIAVIPPRLEELHNRFNELSVEIGERVTISVQSQNATRK